MAGIAAARGADRLREPASLAARMVPMLIDILVDFRALGEGYDRPGDSVTAPMWPTDGHAGVLCPVIDGSAEVVLPVYCATGRKCAGLAELAIITRVRIRWTGPQGGAGRQ